MVTDKGNMRIAKQQFTLDSVLLPSLGVSKAHPNSLASHPTSSCHYMLHPTPHLLSLSSQLERH